MANKSFLALMLVVGSLTATPSMVGAADKVVTVGSDVFVLSDISAVVNNGNRVDVYLKGGQIINVSAATASRVRDALLKLHGGK